MIEDKFMINNKERGFTLGEILVALVIVGILAILVVPGLIKDANNKSKMSLLRGTVTNINSIVQNELVKAGSNDLNNTNICTDSKKFLLNFDPTGKVYDYDDGFSDSYYNYKGGSGAVNTSGSVLLKNGVGLAVCCDCYKTGDVIISIDLNGKKEPNIVGVDYFEVQVITEDDLDKGIHAGDIGSEAWVDINDKETFSGVQIPCHDGNGLACYRLAELSGFDPDYISQDYSKKDNKIDE